MASASLADNDYLALLITGLLILSLASIPLSVGYYLSAGPRLVVLAFGGLFTGSAIAVSFKRRDKRTQERRLLEFLYESGAHPGDKGIQPYLIQDYLGARTDLFEAYVRDLLDKRFISWGDPKKLVITQDGLELLSEIKRIEVVARFLRETTQE